MSIRMLYHGFSATFMVIYVSQTTHFYARRRPKYFFIIALSSILSRNRIHCRFCVAFAMRVFPMIQHVREIVVEFDDERFDDHKSTPARSPK